MANIIIPGQFRQRINLIDDPSQLTGELETVAIEDVGDKRYFVYSQRIDHIVNENEQRRKDNPDWNRNSEFRQVAEIPMHVWNLWETMGITADQKELRKAIMRHKDEYMVVEKNLI